MLFYAEFVKFINRNERSGESVFLVKNETGLLMCKGIIQSYPKGIPLYIKYDSKENDAYIVTEVKAYGYEAGVVINFLASKEFDKVGPYLATKIVNNMGANIFDLNFDEIDFINLAKETKTQIDLLEQILKKLLSYNYFSNLYVYLKQYEITYHQTKMVYDLYKCDALKKIENNPYTLFLADIPFEICERIGVTNGFNKLDKKRIKALVHSVLNNNLSRGNTMIMLKKMLTEIRAYEQKEALKHTETVFILEELLNDEYKLIEDKDDFKVYLKENYIDEECISRNIKRLQNCSLELNNTVSTKEIIKISKTSFSKEQIKAFSMLNRSGVYILTGGPGTGKTTTLNGIINKYIKENPDKTISLCAPTGCAARRMTQATKRKALTIHKLLNLTPYSSTEYIEKLDADFIIVDECSMAEPHIMALLLSAVKNGALVLLCGDKDQLPSVTAGNVFQDIIDSKIVKTYTLTEIFRQEGNNLIIENSKKVIEHNTNLKTNKNFKIIKVESEEKLKDTALSLVKRCYDNSFENFKIFAPAKKTKFSSGVISMNRAIKNIRGKAENTINYGLYSFSVGDNVLFNKNNYDLGYYNGLDGIITSIQKVDGIRISVLADEQTIFLTENELDDLELDYCRTAHKSQGSECDNAIILIPQNPKGMLQSKILYVEITRAKKNVIIITEKDALNKCISTKYEYQRNTGLKDMLMSS